MIKIVIQQKKETKKKQNIKKIDFSKNRFFFIQQAGKNKNYLFFKKYFNKNSVELS